MRDVRPSWPASLHLSALLASEIMKPGINARQLQVFTAVAELGGATKAAQALYRAQSAITRAIQELESSLGVPLFERKLAGMLLTANGQTLLIRARRIAQEFELAHREIAAAALDDTSISKAQKFPLLFDRRRLTAFIELGKLQHMPTVANSLGITQQAVSASINTLESGFGVPLFQRTPRGMLLTDAGKLLAFRAKRALAELRRAETEMQSLSGAQNGKLEGRVTVGVTLGRTYILPRAIARVISAHPGLQIVTMEGSFDVLAADLRAGDIDFILGALRSTDYARDLLSESLMNDRMGIFVRRGHPLMRKREIRINDLVDARWILPSPGTLTRRLFDMSFAHHGVKPPPAAVETSDLSILRDLLLNSDMLTAISLHWLYHERMSGDLGVLDFNLYGTERIIGMTQRRDSYLPPGASALMKAVRQVISSMR